jgi:hypothetical protein
MSRSRCDLCRQEYGEEDIGQRTADGVICVYCLARDDPDATDLEDG